MFITLGPDIIKVPGCLGQQCSYIICENRVPLKVAGEGQVRGH